MQDIWFDITTREIIMRKNDFALTANPSIQNGGNLLYSRGANPLAPAFGIGLIPQIIEGPARQLTYELNRWQAQAYQDGATLARWTAAPGSNSDEITDISYI